MSRESNTKIEVPPSSAELQDPLPESNWFWRRWFVFTVTIFFSYLLWDYGDRISAVAMLQPAIGVPALARLMVWYVITIQIMALFYLVAPSAEQVIKMVQTARSLRQGVVFSSSAKVESPRGSASSSSTAGQGMPAADPDPAAAPAAKPKPTETLE